MIVAKWKIQSEHITPRWFWVRVYDTPEAMRRVAHRVAPDGDYSSAVGTVQEVTPWIPDRYEEHEQDDIPVSELSYPENGFAGVVRLCSDYLYTEVIYHEVLHAAVTAFRMNIDSKPKLEGMLAEERPNEEALAYITGQLAADMDDGIRKYFG